MVTRKRGDCDSPEVCNIASNGTTVCVVVVGVLLVLDTTEQKNKETFSQFVTGRNICSKRKIRGAFKEKEEEKALFM